MIVNLGTDKKAKLKTVRQILLFLVFFEILGIVFNGCIQQIEYCYYIVNPTKFTVTQAEVLEKNSGGFKILNFELVPISKTFITYEINGIVYKKWTLAFPQSIEGEIIQVALDKNDYTHLICSEPYQIDKVDKIIYLRQSMCIIVLFIIYIALKLIEKNNLIVIRRKL